MYGFDSASELSLEFSIVFSAAVAAMTAQKISAAAFQPVKQRKHSHKRPDDIFINHRIEIASIKCKAIQARPEGWGNGTTGQSSLWKIVADRIDHRVVVTQQ